MGPKTTRYAGNTTNCSTSSVCSRDAMETQASTASSRTESCKATVTRGQLRALSRSEMKE